jgi:hypothetical protein
LPVELIDVRERVEGMEGMEGVEEEPNPTTATNPGPL